MRASLALIVACVAGCGGVERIAQPVPEARPEVASFNDGAAERMMSTTLADPRTLSGPTSTVDRAWRAAVDASLAAVPSIGSAETSADPLTPEGYPDESAVALITASGGSTVATNANLQTGLIGGLASDSWMSFYGNSWFLDISVNASSRGNDLGTFSSIPNEDLVSTAQATGHRTKTNSLNVGVPNVMCELRTMTTRRYEARFELSFTIPGVAPQGHKWGRVPLTTVEPADFDIGGFSPNCAPAEGGGSGGGTVGAGGVTRICTRIIEGYIDLEWDQVVIESDREWCYDVPQYAEVRSDSATAGGRRPVVIAATRRASLYPVRVRIACDPAQPDLLLVDESRASSLDIANAVTAVDLIRGQSVDQCARDRWMIVSRATLRGGSRPAQLDRGAALLRELRMASPAEVPGIGHTRSVQISR